MVVGNGLIARGFAGYREEPGVVIFASGVSNSRETNPAHFARERALLQQSAPDAGTFVYFSTCSVEDPGPQSPYVRHKLAMEALVDGLSAGIVIRLPQVVGAGGNPNTLINFLFQHIREGRRFPLQRAACRNLIDVEDVFAIVDALLRKGLRQGRLNIASPYNPLVEELVGELEEIVGRKAVYDWVDGGVCREVDLSEIEALWPAYRDRFPVSYVRDLLRRYLSPT